MGPQNEMTGGSSRISRNGFELLPMPSCPKRPWQQHATCHLNRESSFDFILGRYRLEISIIRKGFPIWIAHAAYEGSDDRHGFQTPLSLIEPG